MSEKPQMLITVDAEKLADWIEQLARLAYDSPKVTVEDVAKDPAKAMHGAIVELQRNVQGIVSNIAATVRGSNDWVSWFDVVQKLRQES